jgi:hypothetical protein
VNVDELARMARNRGLKLVRSRVRTPTKRRFGKLGLEDAKGAALLGIDEKGPKAKPDEIEKYLRSLDETAWGASIGRRKKS